MADKFTRSGNVEGDIWYATTASSSKSLESLEDSIDDKLMTYITSDFTTASSSGNTVQTLATINIPANSVRNNIIIFVFGIVNGSASGSGEGSMALKVGPTGSEVTKQAVTGSSGSSGYDIKMPFTMIWKDSTQTFTSAVSILVVCTPSASNIGGTYTGMIVLGI